MAAVKISELQKLLAQFKRKHGDLEILEQRYSDYAPMDQGSSIHTRGEPLWDVVQAAAQQDGAYLIRDHYSLTEEQRKAMNFRTYLLYRGN